MITTLALCKECGEAEPEPKDKQYDRDFCL